MVLQNESEMHLQPNKGIRASQSPGLSLTGNKKNQQNREVEAKNMQIKKRKHAGAFFPEVLGGARVAGEAKE